MSKYLAALQSGQTPPEAKAIKEKLCAVEGWVLLLMFIKLSFPPQQAHQ